MYNLVESGVDEYGLGWVEILVHVLFPRLLVKHKENI